MATRMFMQLDPDKHNTLAKRWLNASHAGPTLIYQCGLLDITRHFPNDVLILTRRLRRRPNIKTLLGKCLVFAEMISEAGALFLSAFLNMPVCPGYRALNTKYRTNVSPAWIHTYDCMVIY